MTRSHVVVIGGGIAGLSAAWHLVNNENAPKITVLEASTRFGGKIQTTEFNGFDVDTAADAFLKTVPAAVELCAQLGISDELVAPAWSNAFVLSRGRLHNFPLSTVLGIPSRVTALGDVVSTSAKVRALADLVMPSSVGRSDRDTDVGRLIRKRLGHEIAERLVDPLVGGINAGSIDQLSLDAANPQIKALAKSQRSLLRAAQSTLEARNTQQTSPFLAPNSGMQRIVDVLVQRLKAKGVELRHQQPVRSVSYDTRWRLQLAGESIDTDAIVLALPAFAGAQILRDIDAHASTLLASIRYSSVAMVRLVYRRDKVADPLNGSGFVVPAVDRTVMTACSWTSSKWSRLHNPHHAIMRLSAGRFTDQSALEFDDDVLVKSLHEELQGPLGITAAPEKFDVVRWKNAFPQYEPGHAQRIELLQSYWSKLPGLQLAGASYEGIGIPACIASGTKAAKATLEYLSKQMREAGGSRGPGGPSR